MKDLFILVADKQQQVVMEEILKQHHALGIREIHFDIGCHPKHDPGVRTDGAKLVRFSKYKDEYEKVLLMLDYEGSGWGSSRKTITPDEGIQELQSELDSENVSWSGKSGVVLVVPEIEIWLWQKPKHLYDYIGINELKAKEVFKANLELFIRECVEGIELYKRKQLKKIASFEDAITICPKELLELLISKTKSMRRKKPMKFIFYKEIASKASLDAWRKCDSFDSLVLLLQEWFPTP